MSIEPKDKVLYEKAKCIVYEQYTTHSAYRSGALVKKYKEMFLQKHGKINPYIGNKTPNKGLKRWFREEWKADNGKSGYTNKSSVYRPTIRISQDTPKTFSEISKKELKKAKIEKAKTGRVNRF